MSPFSIPPTKLGLVKCFSCRETAILFESLKSLEMWAVILRLNTRLDYGGINSITEHYSKTLFSLDNDSTKLLCRDIKSIGSPGAPRVKNPAMNHMVYESDPARDLCYMSFLISFPSFPSHKILGWGHQEGSKSSICNSVVIDTTTIVT